MNHNQTVWMLPLAGSLFLVAASTRADEPAGLERDSLDSTNRLTGSVRFGLNISGKFTSPGGSLNTRAPMRNQQHTGHGDRYNYDDGYVFPDNTGSHDGRTWYWGYNNPSQL